MDYTFVIPVLISFVLSVIMGPIVIPILRKMKMKQTERVEGVESHLQKAGTPTMGGVMILASIVITSLFYVKDYPKIIPILFVTLGFGLIGFLDDYLKVVMKRSDGLYPKQKMALQIVVTAIFAYYPVFRGKILEHWMACHSAFVCSGDWYGKRCQFYRRTGRSCLQRDSAGCYLFHGCRSGNKERDRTGHLRGSRSSDGIFTV